MKRARLLLLVLSWAPRAIAAPADTCIDDNTAGQEARHAGNLRLARTRLTACSSAECPSIVRGDCVTELARVDQEMPSILVTAYDGLTETAAVQLSIDGGATIARLDGLAIDLDPGEHHLRIAAPDGRTASGSVVLHVGEKHKTVTLRLPAASAAAATSTAPAPAPGRSIPTGTWIAGAVTVVAAGSFAAFALGGRGTEDRLDECAPHCQRDDVNTMRRQYLFADVSLGVGIVAAAAAVYLYLRQSPSASPAAQAMARGYGVQFRFQ